MLDIAQTGLDEHARAAAGHRLAETAARSGGLASCGAGELTHVNQEGLRGGSGNVFADLRVPHPEEAPAKAELPHKITKLIERRRLTQAEAAEILDVDQPKVSALRCGRLSGFSLDRLVRFVVLLGHDVEIVVKKRSRRGVPARLLVA